jgi:hypothetical protein
MTCADLLRLASLEIDQRKSDAAAVVRARSLMQRLVPQVDATIAKKETEAVAELAQIPGQAAG